jgi:hypothetical protein
MSAKRLLLHVGTPKTGTSQLQDVLFRNRRRLALHQIHYPADRFDAHFLAALDLMQLPWGGLETEAVGRWDRLAGRVRNSSGTSIISHEILAAASRSQAARALESLGETELHLVVSVRDLVRQIPAEWQENVKHRSVIPYAKFLETIQSPAREDRIASWFWSVQEIPDILNRWGAGLPPERIHIVTVPPTGAEPGLLWSRFEEAFGLAGLDLTIDTERANPSLGVPETALIRRINRSANKVVAPPDYRPLVRELLAHQTLSRRTRSPRLALPPDLHPWVRELSQSWVTEIQERGYDVIGDLGDLLGAPPATAYADPDRPNERLVARASVDAITALLIENARLQKEIERRHHDVAELTSSLDRAHLRPTYRLREKLVGKLTGSGGGRTLLKVYRRLRGRSSASA